MKKMKVLDSCLLWLGAGVSLAEILAGTSIAPLGFSQGMLAVLLGHVIGCTVMFGAGMIGALEKKSAMETVQGCFGKKGGLLFAALNVAQLAGWTAIMEYDGALAADGIYKMGSWFWTLMIGLLILLWIKVGFDRMGKLNLVAVGALLLLSAVLCRTIFAAHGVGAADAAAMPAISFGAAVELSAAMPISWLPLISDYTSKAEKPVRATLGSVISYGAISCFMYFIGMGAVIETGSSDISQIMLKAGLGVAGLVIIVFATVTTTFLDAYSAGESCLAFKSWKAQPAAMIVVVIGTIGAMLYPMDQISGFLYLIGSVFAPMTAIMLSDYFLFHKKEEGQISLRNLVIWLFGFVLYRFLLRVDTPLGETFPDMLITTGVCVVVECVVRGHQRMCARKAQEG